MTHDQKYVNNGNEFSAKGQYDNALREYQHAIFLNPDNASALAGCGLCWNQKQGYNAAIIYFKRALNIDPANFSALSGRGYALHCLYEFKKAMQDYEKAIQIRPDDSDLLRVMGYCHYWLHDNPNAARCLNRAIELNPKDSSSLYCRGYVLYYYSDYDKSIADFTNASTINDNISVHCPLGYCWYRKWNFEKAISHFDKAISFDRNDSVAFDGRGAAFAALKDYARAIQDFDSAVSIQPDNPHYRHHRGLAWRALGDTVLAEKDFAGFQKLQQNYKPAFNMNSVLALKSLHNDIRSLSPEYSESPPIFAANERRRLLNQACDRLRFLTEIMLESLNLHLPSTTIEDHALRLRWKLDTFQIESARMLARMAAYYLRRSLLALLAICEKNEGKVQAGPSADGMPDSVSSWQQFHNLACLLPEYQGDVFGLIWYLGLTVEETASLLALDPSSAARIWQSARLQLASQRQAPLPEDDEWSCQELIRNAG